MNNSNSPYPVRVRNTLSSLDLLDDCYLDGPRLPLSTNSEINHSFLSETNNMVENQSIQLPLIGAVASSLNFFLIENFQRSQFLKGRNVILIQDRNVWVPGANTDSLIEGLVSKFGFNIQYGPNNYFVCISQQAEIAIEMFKKSEEISRFKLYANSTADAKVVLDYLNSFTVTDNRVSFKWFYGEQGESLELADTLDTTLSQDLYPYIPDIQGYMKAYLESNANIMILYGPPGTGKSSFIKHLIEMSKKVSYVTYDVNLLSQDYVFASYISDTEAGTFVIEDADSLLLPRSEGNHLVAKFLNVGDGIIKIKGKKLIFSTNLQTKADIDPALIRPGRCFDVVNFRELTEIEAKVVATNRNLILPTKPAGSVYSLGEIFNETANRTFNRNKVGF